MPSNISPDVTTKITNPKDIEPVFLGYAIHISTLLTSWGLPEIKEEEWYYDTMLCEHTWFVSKQEDQVAHYNKVVFGQVA